MANLERQFPNGVPEGAVIPAEWFEYIDSNLPNLPNATDGSDHAGTIVLGGVKANHITKKEHQFTTIAAPGLVQYTLDADVYNQWIVTQGNVGSDQTVELDFEGVQLGDEVAIVVIKGSSGSLYDLTLVWGWTGAGDEILHLHPEGDDQVDQSVTGSTTWRGQAVTMDGVITIVWHVEARTS